MSCIVVFENQFVANGRSRSGKRKLSADVAFSRQVEVPSVCLGTGNSWLNFWQPYFVAAWKSVNNEGTHFSIQADLGILDELKSVIIEAKKRAYLPSSGMNIISEKLSFRNILTNVGGKGLQYFKDKKVITALCMLHLDSLVDIFHNHCIIHCRTIHNALIKRLLEMMDVLYRFLPRSQDDLHGTPWELKKYQNSYEIADGRWEDLRESFKLAAANPCLIGVIY